MSPFPRPFPRFALFIAILLLSALSELYAQPKVTYIYDDLGRLVRVVNEANECATYEYDAVGNLLRITRGANCLQPPSIDTLSPDSGNAGETTCAVINGNNFLGATVTSDRPDIQSSRVRVLETTIDLCLNIPVSASPGAAKITVATAGGSAERTFTVNPRIILVNQNTTIDETDQRFEGASLTITGPVTVTVDGSHTFTNLILMNGAVLTHNPTTATKVNKLDITLTGTLQIDPTSRIDVSGRGFLGGRQPGNPFGTVGMTLGFERGSAGASGGSYGGLGGSFGLGSSGSVYGNFSDPNEPGSGGASVDANRAGSGGGLIRIVAQTMQLDGAIRADGGTVSCCDVAGGSGGGIRIGVGTLTGSGTITANGSTGSVAAGGGGGRVAVYYQSLVGFDPAKVSAFAGPGQSGAPNGGAGTVYLQGPARESGELIVDNNNLSTTVVSTPISPSPSGVRNLTHLRVRRAARLRIDDQINLTTALEVSLAGELSIGKPVTASAIKVSNGGIITQLFTTATVVFKIDLSAATLTIDGTSRIDVTGRGFLGGRRPGNPFFADGMTVGFQRGSTGRSGGSYGGLGGSFGGTANPVYGDFANPNEPGSGGGAADAAGAGSGGGLIRIVAQTMQLDGAIRANGGGVGCCDAAGGSGGGVRINVGTLIGTGSITTNGGNGQVASGGGGGRVAVYYQDATAFDFSRVIALGGLGNNAPNGQPGTVFTQQQTFVGQAP